MQINDKLKVQKFKHKSLIHPSLLLLTMHVRNSNSIEYEQVVISIVELVFTSGIKYPKDLSLMVQRFSNFICAVNKLP